MTVSSRHIRHDWPEWVDWHTQKTIKTMCDVRSRPSLCGIPGITYQPETVEVNGKVKWGWCGRCVQATWPYYMPPALTSEVTHPAIIELHQKAMAALAPQYRHYFDLRFARNCN